SLMVRNETPRGEHNHLYEWQTVASKPDASTGCTPTAWVVSHRMKIPVAAAASRIASISAISPVADWANENATSQVCSVMADASAASGTERAVMSGRCRNGKTTELKSPSTHRMSTPAGAAEAKRLTITEVWEPMATRSSGTPTREA